MYILVYNKNYCEVGHVDKETKEIKKGDKITMEVDLRSSESNRRTLHFFINDVHQKLFFSRLPKNVNFAV